MKTAEVDVLIVGLGPGGGAAAAICARRGLRVLAIERKREVGAPVQCAEYIPLPLQPHAQSAGVVVQSIDSMRTWLPSNSAHVTPCRGLMIDRTRFDRSFADAACANGGQVALDTRLIGLDVAASYATLRSATGIRDVRYRVLIAGDGPFSTVARLIRLPRLDVIHTRQYTVALSHPSSVTEVYLSVDYPGGYAWLFPKGRVANLGVGFDTLAHATLKVMLDRLHARLANDGRVGREVLAMTAGPIPVGGLRLRLNAGNILFVGDAAGFTHPVSGAGIAAAVMSGERAGEAAVQFVRAARAGACDDYDQDMRELFGSSLERARDRRRELAACRNLPRWRVDATHRRGWIGFPEYYAS
jgi:geranylgeranyl reductase family protein